MVDSARGDPARPLADAGRGRSDDALLGGQKLGGRVAPVAARGRHDVPASGADMVGARIRVGEDPDDASRPEELGRETQLPGRG